MCLGDVALVRSVLPDGTLLVDVGGRSSTLSTLLLDRVPEVGDWVLGHSGLAVTVLSEHEARQALAVRAGSGP